jgi:hypothetical protein
VTIKKNHPVRFDKVVINDIEFSLFGNQAPTGLLFGGAGLGLGLPQTGPSLGVHQPGRLIIIY